jgi:hypothetical protein
VNNEKSFLQELYKALKAEETHDNTEATSPTRGLDGSEVFLVATDPPPGGEADVTYQEDALKVTFPEKNLRGLLPVGVPSSATTTPPVEGVCKPVLKGPQKLLDLLQEIGRSSSPSATVSLGGKSGQSSSWSPLR